MKRVKKKISFGGKLTENCSRWVELLEGKKINAKKRKDWTYERERRKRG